MPRILVFLFKHSLLLILGGLVIGRLFFPQTLEDTVIVPARRMPVFGQVLGVTWDKLGEVGPTLSKTSATMTQSTVSLADKVESSSLPIDETVQSIVSSTDPKTAASQLVDKKVDAAVQSIKDLPTNVAEDIKDEVRKEMYKQICQDWLTTPEPSPKP